MSAQQVFKGYLGQIENAIQHENGQLLASILEVAKLDDTTNRAILMQTNLEQVVSRFVSNPWHKIVALHLCAHQLRGKSNYTAAFKAQKDAADGMYYLMVADRDSSWWLPAVNLLIKYTRLISQQADDICEGKEEKHKYLRETEDLLKKYFGKMIVDRSPLHCSTKMGCLFVTVHLFKIYFKLNNLRLCTNLIQTVNINFPSFDDYNFPQAQTVSYNYYLGRIQVFEEQYEKAEECLNYALAHCHKDNVRNKRRILQFLIPVKLVLCKYPQIRLLKKYNLMQFDGLIHATRTGNLKMFNENLEQHQEYFIQKGIFLILEKLKTFVYRNLFRKVHVFVSAEKDEKKANQLSLHELQTALKINEIDMEVDELECIIANLIYQKYIKGYIAHKRCVVLSRADPFPTPQIG